MTSPSAAAPTVVNTPHSGEQVSTVEEASALFQVRHVSVDLSVVGRHVVGDVTFEIEAQRGVDLQVQWATLVATSSASTYDDGTRQRAASNETSSSGFQQRQVSHAKTFIVPIVGAYNEMNNRKTDRWTG